LLNRLKTHLGIENIIHTRTSSLERLKNGIVIVLANMVERRDMFTGKHLERTTRYLIALINKMQKSGIYTEEMRQWNLNTVVSSVRLHDIGKIAISDLLLNKPGPLTPEEFEIMKTHAKEGENIIDEIIIESGDGFFLQHAKQFAGYHHEKWDGSGYPRGLKGKNIPLQGRIMALVDVYDALVSNRPYKKAFTHEKAIEVITQGNGTHFDPEIVKAFLECEKEMDGIRLSENK